MAHRSRSLSLGAAVLCVLALCACGKKAPLRLEESQTAERAPALRASVREDRVRLDFQVPAHRMFPEREEPWVLARILRQAGQEAEIVEVGTVFKAEGFVFGERLFWSDQPPTPGTFSYRVQFRDGMRRRRALTVPLEVAWERVPAAPTHLTAVGNLRSIVLAWAVPADGAAGLVYRVYRRERAAVPFHLAAPDPVTGSSFVDARVDPAAEFCYVVRAVLSGGKQEVEGPASDESCARPAREVLPGEKPPEPMP